MTAAAAGGDPPEPALGPILCATVTVPNLDEATVWYTRWLGWEVSDGGVIEASLAAAWRAPRCTGSSYRIVSPAAGQPGGVRLVERERPLDRSPLRVPGWRSIELVVSDVLELRRRLEGSPFRIVGEPKGLEFNPSIVAMQAVGPGREMLYLTQTSDETVFRLPRAQRLVDHMFIAVLSTPDLLGSYDFYRERFGAAGHLRETATALEAVNRELELPIEREHPITALQLAHRSLVEIDLHPPELAGEIGPPEDLPGGTAAVTFAHRDLDEVSSPWLAAPAARAEMPYLGRRAATLRGVAGELIELVEAGT